MEKTKSILLFICLLRFGITENYRILGLMTAPLKSHMAMFERLMKGLAEKGHNVDVLSYFPQKSPTPRYHDLSIQKSTTMHFNNFSVNFVVDNSQNEILMLKLICTVGGTYLCEAVFNSSSGIELKNTKVKYDLLITSIFGSDCMLGYAHYFQIPVVGIVTSVSLPWSNGRIGNPDNPSYIPNYLVPYVTPLTLEERIYNTIVLIGAKLGYDRYSYEPSNKIARKFFGEDLPDLRELAYNTNLILVNSHFSINQARPMVPNLIEVGGLHIHPPKPLPDASIRLKPKLEEYLQPTLEYKGVIYLSTGSLIQSETFPKDKLKAIFQALSELPYKVLWKASRDKFPTDVDIPSNIKFESWMPQLDILCNPNVKLFITHGGLMGTQEGIYCAVPMLGIPLFADQALNLKTFSKLGLALTVKFDAVTKENILNAARALLEEPRYKDNAKLASKLFKDRPVSPLDTAIYWIEYVIRYKGAPHLRSVGANLPWYQYYLVDVVITLFTAASVIIALIYHLLRIIYLTLVCKLKTKLKTI